MATNQPFTPVGQSLNIPIGNGEADRTAMGVARTARTFSSLADPASGVPATALPTQCLAVHEQTAWTLHSLLAA